MKKTTALVLLLILVCECLTGCNNKGGYENPTGYDMDFSMAEDMPQFNTEEYNEIKENSFEDVSVSPLSTFAIDVDTGSYSNFRRMVNKNEIIPSGAIRTEEMLNYFDYSVTDISDGRFSVQSEIHQCPWNEQNGLLMLTVQANEVDIKNNGNNFVFLMDTSGSMGWQDKGDKIDLAKKAFKLLAKELAPTDKVSVVTYAGSADTLLDGCEASDYKKICKAIDSVSTEGGTNGSGGIEAAYQCAVKNFIEGGNNRVIIASDGDMNLGITSQSGLVDLIKEKKEFGVFLTTLGFGTGNYSDANMERIADAGNGNYFYIDCEKEAVRVLCDKLMQTTLTVAKDVKIQVEFNPAQVYKYRLLGYENRIMSSSDFEDDTKDGGEIGAGQQVTVLYEIVFAGENDEHKELKYQEHIAKGDSNEICSVAIRYKAPDGDTSSLEEYPIKTEEKPVSEDWSLAAGIAELSSILRNSDYIGSATLESSYGLVNAGKGSDEWRDELAKLISTVSKKNLYESAS